MAMTEVDSMRQLPPIYQWSSILCVQQTCRKICASHYQGVGDSRDLRKKKLVLGETPLADFMFGTNVKNQHLRLVVTVAPARLTTSTSLSCELYKISSTSLRIRTQKIEQSITEFEKLGCTGRASRQHKRFNLHDPLTLKKLSRTECVKVSIMDHDTSKIRLYSGTETIW